VAAYRLLCTRDHPWWPPTVASDPRPSVVAANRWMRR